MRSSILDTVREDYLTVARAKGLRDDVVRRRHAVPNALLPSVSLIGDRLRLRPRRGHHDRDGLSVPGLGLATSDAIENRLPMLQALFLLSAVALIVGQPDRRPALRLPRSPDPEAGPVTATTAGGTGDGAERRPVDPAAGLDGTPAGRSRAASSVPGRPAGVAGLAILLLFVFIALAAPMIVPRFGTTPADRTTTRPGRPRAPSSRSAPTRSGAACRPSSSGARGSACSSAWWPRCSPSSSARSSGSPPGSSVVARAPADGHQRLVPRHPVPAAGHRAGRGARPLGARRSSSSSA